MKFTTRTALIILGIVIIGITVDRYFIGSSKEAKPKEVIWEPRTPAKPPIETTVKEVERKIVYGYIQTKVEGMDVGKVNIWNSQGTERFKVCALSNGDEVEVISLGNPYYLVKSTSDNSCIGYCMAGFVKVQTLTK